MKKIWTREQYSVEGTGFADEILKRLAEATDLEAKRMVLEKACHAIRSRTFADAAFLSEESDASDKTIQELFHASAMFFTDGPWKKFSELVYTPYILDRLKKEAKKRQSR